MNARRVIVEEGEVRVEIIADASLPLIVAEIRAALIGFGYDPELVDRYIPEVNL